MDDPRTQSWQQTSIAHDSICYVKAHERVFVAFTWTGACLHRARLVTTESDGANTYKYMHIYAGMINIIYVRSKQLKYRLVVCITHIQISKHKHIQLQFGQGRSQQAGVVCVPKRYLGTGIYHMLYTCYTHYIHIIYTLYTHYIHITYTLHTHYIHIIYTSHRHTYIYMW